ncbi:MAG: UvrD-helicase domain-containing protein, partial [Actinomycetota bacterium]
MSDSRLFDEPIDADEIPHPAETADAATAARGPSPFREGLNPDQLDAVVHEGGPLLVVAGAGSGKTRVLTHRIANLVHEGVPPSKILAITFTNKAAAEMRERLVELVGPAVRAMWVSTFHSACVRILRANGELLGYPRQFSIYDAADANRLTGYVIRDLALDPKRFAPRAVHARISLWKNELVLPSQATAEAGNIFERKHAEIYTEYQARLLKAGAMDFDDLLVNAVRLFREHGDVLEHYRQRFAHICVDEYQDTNKAQNDLVLLLAGGHRNVCVVGDTDQCLPPGTMIATPRGQQPIESLEAGDEVLGASGHATAHPAQISYVHEGRYDGAVVTVSTDGGTVTATPEHLIPARLVPQPGRHLVYLMFRGDRGWRIGRTTGARPSRAGHVQHGLFVRSNQEHADAIWILEVCDSVADASYFEAYYAATYGLPTACFHAKGRALSMDDDRLERLYDRLDTDRGAKQLMADRLLSIEFPHHRPQNGARRQVVNLTMFSDRRTNVGYHRVQWSSNRDDVIDRLRSAGVKLRSSKHRSLRYETSWKDYRRALADAKRIAALGRLDIRRRLALGGVTYDLIPAAHLTAGMEVLLLDESASEPAWVTATVDRTDLQTYSGPVYDLEVDRCHTYCANGMLVHNSVYAFRGADFRNILEFEDAFPDVTTIVLDQNYRSTQTILD